MSRVNVTIPTELRKSLVKNVSAFNAFGKLPIRIKKAYASYVIESDSHKDRICRSKKITAWLNNDMRAAKACSC